jgi:hypothetical protein
MKFMAQLNATGYYNKRCVCPVHVCVRQLKTGKRENCACVRHEYSRKTWQNFNFKRLHEYFNGGHIKSILVRQLQLRR